MNEIPEPYQTNSDYELSGNGKILYNYMTTLNVNQELATISGEIVVRNEETKVANATLSVGEMGGQFSAIGKTDEFKFINGSCQEAVVPCGGAYGKFDEITISTGVVREENVNYFKLQDATVVWDKQGKVMGGRERVTIRGNLTIGGQTFSVEARYFDAGSGDWEVTIDDKLGGKTVLTANNPNFECVAPLVLADLGEIYVTSLARRQLLARWKLRKKRALE